MVFRTINLLAAGVLFAASAFADINVGYLSILADSPTPGSQELTISNVTGDGTCSVDFTACTNLSFTDWALTVNYTSSYYNTVGGQSVPSPFVYTDAGAGPYGGFGDITAGGSLALDFDLCGATPGCGSPPVTTITSVEFSGQISPAAICLYDAGSGGCNAGNPMFFANPKFDLTWNANSSLGSPYVDENNTPYAQSPDITVTSQGSSGATPEPSEYFGIAAISCALILLRLKFHKRA